MENIYDVIIVGGGPAGLTAAIYATRANLKTLIIESYMPGGKLSKTYEIENYPGIEKIGGSELAIQLMNHGLKFGAEMDYGEVVNISNDKTVTLSDGRQFQAKSVIVASGTRERTLQLPRAEEFTGRGISYCAVCDGSFYKDQDVVVIGGGNSALEESLYLSKIVNHIYIVIRRDQFRAEEGIVARVLAEPKISIIYKHIPEALLIENDQITGIRLKNVDDQSTQDLSISGIFPYIGADPCTEFVPKEILDEKGYILANTQMATAIPGFFAAGDVIAKELRQVVTACGDGAVAANSAIHYLQKLNK